MDKSEDLFYLALQFRREYADAITQESLTIEEQTAVLKFAMWVNARLDPK
jgi:hypothetical protein